MKKIAFLGATALLGLTAVSFARVGEPIVAGAEGEETALAALLNGVGKTYTKKTEFFLNETQAAKSQYFHAGANRMRMNTYYDETTNALLMGNFDGTFATIKSGYIKDGDNMEHYAYTGTGASTADLFTARAKDYEVKNTSPNDYFVNISTLAAHVAASPAGTWTTREYYGKNVYVHTVPSGGLVINEQGNYTDETLHLFQYFAAPMLLQNEASAFVSPKAIEVYEADSFLSIRILLKDVNSGFVTLKSEDAEHPENNRYILSEARVYKGLSLNPGKAWNVSVFKDPTVDHPMEYNPDAWNPEQYKAVVTLNANEKFKVREGSTYKGFWKLENQEYFYSGEGDDPDIYARGTGSYTFYWKPALDKLYIAAPTYTITMEPGVWTANNAVFYAWVWNPNSGYWTDQFVAAGDVYKFEVSTNVTKMKIVRMDPSKTVPSWDAEWNNSGDQDIHYGGTFQIEGWDNYHWAA